MLYALIAIFALIVVVLMLRLRARGFIDSNNRLLFVGLGRTGQEFDFVAGKGVVKLFGIKIKTFSFEKDAEDEVEIKETKKVKKPKKVKRSKDEKPGRVRPWRQIWEVVKGSTGPSWNYFVRLLRSLILEEMQGKIEAGFDSPELTGRAFGYYQAMIGAVPALAGRVVYVPNWTEASFAGEFRMSVALPLYRLVFRTIQYLWALPLMRIIRLAIGTKEIDVSDKGEQDVK